MTHTGKTTSGVPMLSGFTDYYAQLGSKLIKTPFDNIDNIKWNREVNLAIDAKDLDMLLDMNQIFCRDKGICCVKDKYEKR